MLIEYGFKSLYTTCVAQGNQLLWILFLSYMIRDSNSSFLLGTDKVPSTVLDALRIFNLILS